MEIEFSTTDDLFIHSSALEVWEEEETTSFSGGLYMRLINGAPRFAVGRCDFGSEPKSPWVYTSITISLEKWEMESLKEYPCPE